MPELPDIVLYIEALERRILGVRLEAVRISSPFVVRSVEPPVHEIAGRPVRGLSRMGKRIVLAFDDELFLVIHLMIAGRLRWRARGTLLPKRGGLAAFDFPDGTILFTEASKLQRASLHVMRGAAALAEHDRRGLEVLEASPEAFRAAITRENHTLKRTLTDPTILSGIGNAYSDEILHAARLSPLALSGRLDSADVERLYAATRATLRDWTDRLRRECGDGFPEKVTAFREGMAVHGRYREPCPVCGSPVQRIRYAANEANYCAVCQTGGKVLADRAMSKLLREDWPRSIDEWEAKFRK